MRRFRRLPRLFMSLTFSALPPQDADDRQQDDLEVEPGRPVLDVVVVPLDAVGQRRLATEAVDLGPARDAGLDAVAVLVPVDLALETLDVADSLGARTDQGHVAAQDVE